VDPALHGPLWRTPKPVPRRVHLTRERNRNHIRNRKPAGARRGREASAEGGRGATHFVEYFVCDEVGDRLGVLRRRASPGRDPAPQVPERRRRGQSSVARGGGGGGGGGDARADEAPGAAPDREDDDAGLHGGGGGSLSDAGGGARRTGG
jgi:hypothetical protein